MQQIDCFRKCNEDLAKNTLAAKFSNTIKLIKRSQHDNEVLRTNDEINKTVDVLKESIVQIYQVRDIPSMMGIEGYCAKKYFSIFSELISKDNSDMKFNFRTKRPPLDTVNAVLSLVYTLMTNDYASALETVGLDSYIGFCHSLRSGRVSLACDMVEETRCIAERFVLTIINLNIITKKDFQDEVSGAVFLNDEGRKKVISKWQEKKRTDFKHPYLNQKIQFGLIPYVQANLLAKFIRGDIDEYPPLLIK